MLQVTHLTVNQLLVFSKHKGVSTRKSILSRRCFNSELSYRLLRGKRSKVATTKVKELLLKIAHHIPFDLYMFEFIKSLISVLVGK